MTPGQMLDDLPKACDRGAKVDAQGFKNSWVGYKLHIDTAEGGIPVSCILSSASLHDGQAAIPLADMSAQRVTYLYECMDNAYDAAQIHDHTRMYDRASIIDTSPRSNKGLKESLARERKAANRASFVHPTVQRYGERTAVERMNGRLKDEFGVRHLQVRGHKKVQAHLMFGVAVLCVDQITRLLIWTVFQTRPPPDCLHNAGYTDMPEAWEVCTRRHGLNGFFVESGLDSAVNPRESRRVETRTFPRISPE